MFCIKPSAIKRHIADLGDIMESGLCQKDQTEMILNVKQKVHNDRKIN